jgi:hypothetical protein
MSDNFTNIKRLVKIPEFLRFVGFEPINRKGDFLHYRSPLREDKNPSFWVNTRTDTCGDFNGDRIGDVINLAARWYHCDIKTAAANIADTFRLGGFSFAKPMTFAKASSHPTAAATDNRRIFIRHIQDIQNAALLQYIAQRGISTDTARKYLKEVYYTTSPSATARPYFALAFRNDKGGYELRSKYFKGCSATKSITTITNHSATVLIFEGFMDFLSCVEYWNSKNKAIPYDVIVLNSTANANKTDLSKYTTIKLMLDNDQSGRSTAAAIAAKYSDKHIEDITAKMFVGTFQGCKDFNDYWKKLTTK